MFGVDFVDRFPSLVFLDYISPFNICCKAGFMVLNYPNLCLLEKLFISSSILNEILIRYSDLGCRCFPLSTLNISCHSLMACGVSAERSAVKCVGFPLYVAVAAASKLFQVCLTLSNPIDSSRPGSPIPGMLRQEHWSGLPFPSPMHESEK